MNKQLIRSLMVLAVSSLAACGGGSSSGSDTPKTGQLKLSITDAPVDDAKHVYITITGVTLKKGGDSPLQNVSISPELRVDLLALSNGTSELLFTETITSGQYEWARFQLKDDAQIVWLDDSTDDLALPTQNELKTSGNFNVPQDGLAQYTVDWDLRKSIVETGNSGSYKLKPVLHLRDDTQVGFVEGSVDSTFLSTNCNQQGDIAALYLYSGHDITPGEMGGTGEDPIASVKLANDQHFFLGMLNPGNYTLALTCDAGLDTAEDDSPTVIDFPGKAEIVVAQGQAAALDAGDYPFLEYIPVP